MCTFFNHFCVSVYVLCWQVVPDSDAHRAGLQEGDQVLSVNEVDFQDIEHSRVSLTRDSSRLYSNPIFHSTCYKKVKCSVIFILVI